MIAREVLVTAYRAGDRTVQDFVAGYAPRICSEQGLPSPDNEGVMEIVLRSLPPTTIFGVCVCVLFSVVGIAGCSRPFLSMAPLGSR